MDDNVTLVMVAVPPEKAGPMARALVEKRLAACVQALPIASTYRWEGAIERADEVLLLIKSRVDLFTTLEAEVLSLHPYEVPEIIAVTADRVHDAYLGWLMAETHQQPK
ncbi:divalent-cation tolerance protein CutA [Pelagibacterium limicola]|uniref:divalent-cation tolerance protein CutA n=1 Tax=Pelagibacterium limicola TaxID=2791022 RepID=UPI0018AF6214|nr:divalent-cation tolerance protein CutA [Pelagibacterium limicola]